MALIFSAQAQGDIAEILRYGVGHFGREQAVAFVDQLLSKAEILTEFPELGRISEDEIPDDGITRREFPFGQYVLVYRLVEASVFIEAIIPKGRPR